MTGRARFHGEYEAKRPAEDIGQSAKIEKMFR
jgi:hypothetical protein